MHTVVCRMQPKNISTQYSDVLTLLLAARGFVYGGTRSACRAWGIRVIQRDERVSNLVWFHHGHLTRAGSVEGFRAVRGDKGESHDVFTLGSTVGLQAVFAWEIRAEKFVDHRISSARHKRIDIENTKILFTKSVAFVLEDCRTKRLDTLHEASHYNRQQKWNDNLHTHMKCAYEWINTLAQTWIQRCLHDQCACTQRHRCIHYKCVQMATCDMQHLM